MDVKFENVCDTLNTSVDRIKAMETEELRRTCQQLLMIGNAQMEVIRDQRGKIDSLSSDLREMEYEKVDATNRAAAAEEKRAYLDKRLTQSNRDVDRLVTENTAYSKMCRSFPRLSTYMLAIALIETVALCLSLIF